MGHHHHTQHVRGRTDHYGSTDFEFVPYSLFSMTISFLADSLMPMTNNHEIHDRAVFHLIWTCNCQEIPKKPLKNAKNEFEFVPWRSCSAIIRSHDLIFIPNMHIHGTHRMLEDGTIISHPPRVRARKPRKNAKNEFEFVPWRSCSAIIRSHDLIFIPNMRILWFDRM